MSEKGRESEIKGTAPPCEKQREPEPPPPYKPQFIPPVKPRRRTPTAGIYVLQELEDEEKEAWKEARMEIRGTFEGFQRPHHEGQREREEEERKKGEKEEDGERDLKGELGPRL